MCFSWVLEESTSGLHTSFPTILLQIPYLNTSMASRLSSLKLITSDCDLPWVSNKIGITPLLLFATVTFNANLTQLIKMTVIRTDTFPWTFIDWINWTVLICWYYVSFQPELCDCILFLSTLPVSPCSITLNILISNFGLFSHSQNV